MNIRAKRTLAEIRLSRQLGVASRQRKVPKGQPPTGIERDYARELKRIALRTRIALIPLLDELPRLIASARAEREAFDSRGDVGDSRADAGESRRIRELLEQAAASAVIDTSALETLAEKFAVRTQTYQRIQMARQVKAALGIDLSLDVSLTATMEAFISENIALITNMPVKTMSAIEGIVTRGVTSGALHKDIAKDIQMQLGVGERRAALIARDQVGKYYGQVTATRHQSIGVKSFVWNTVGDERVRDEHSALNGETFAYDKPPSEGLPGEPINCRCFADPVFDDLLEGL